MSIEWIRKELREECKLLVEDLGLIDEKEAGELLTDKRTERGRAISRLASLTKIRIMLINGEIINTDLSMIWWDVEEAEALLIPGRESLRYVFPNAIATFEIWRPSDDVLDQQYKIAESFGVAKSFDEP